MVFIYCFDNSIKKIVFKDYHNKNEFWEKYISLKFNIKENNNSAFTKLNEKINNLYNFNKQK